LGASEDGGGRASEVVSGSVPHRLFEGSTRAIGEERTEDPDKLGYEEIRVFLVKRGLLVKHHAFIDTVQQRGNAIHAFADRPIGTTKEYLEYVGHYRQFLENIEASLPNPYV